MRTESTLQARGAAIASVLAASVASAAIVLDGSASARADEPCARIVAPAGLPAAWAGAVGALTKQIAQIPASDCQPMTLSLEPSEEGMRMVALTDDGRRAERTLGDPDSLVATALGLLLTIPAE